MMKTCIFYLSFLFVCLNYFEVVRKTIQILVCLQVVEFIRTVGSGSELATFWSRIIFGAGSATLTFTFKRIF